MKTLSLIFAALLSLSAAAQTYHIGVGFSPYSPPISGTLEIGQMVTDKIYFGAQTMYRTTNAPTISAAPIFGLFHSWNNNQMHELVSGFYLKWEYNVLISNNSEFKNKPEIPYGFGFRHYAGSGFVDFSYCQGQLNFSIGAKFGKPVYR